MLIVKVVLLKARKHRTYLICVDSKERIYFLILVVYIANYKEQVLLISIKSGCRCISYYISADNKQNLIIAIN